MGGAGVSQHICKKETFFIKSLTLTESIFNNFQENELLGKTLKLWVLDKNVIFMQNGIQPRYTVVYSIS